MNLPIGNGYFVWLLDRIAGDNPQQLAREAKQAGLSWVALKIANGTYDFRGNSNYKDTRDRVKEATAALKAEGISVWGWHYVYGYSPVGEAERGAARVAALDLDGYIIDAEGEYKNKQTQAAQYMKELRRRLNVPIAICSFRFPSYHPEFPWQEFLTADINMPQVYWMGAQNSGYQLQKSISEFSKLTKAPMIPVGAAFTEYGWNPTVTSIHDFRNTAAKNGLLGYGWWEWYDAAVRHPEWWEASTDSVEVPDIPCAIKRVMTPYRNLRYRKEPTLVGAVLGYLSPNRAYTITKEQDVWGFVDELKGWVHLGYTIDC